MELKSGEIYRGELHDAEDNWNVQLINVQATARDGKVRRAPLAPPLFSARPGPSTQLLPCLLAKQVSHMEHIFIRGGRVRFVIVPDMLKNAPMVSILSGAQAAGVLSPPPTACVCFTAWTVGRPRMAGWLCRSMPRLVPGLDAARVKASPAPSPFPSLPFPAVQAHRPQNEDEDGGAGCGRPRPCSGGPRKQKRGAHVTPPVNPLNAPFPSRAHPHMPTPACWLVSLFIAGRQDNHRAALLLL